MYTKYLHTNQCPQKIWETLKGSVVALYYGASEMHGSSSQPQYQRITDSEEEVQPLPLPVQLGEITEEELKAYDGTDPKKPLLMAIKVQISQSRMFYGPGMPFALFAGKDASRALAKIIFVTNEDLTSGITGLGVFELAVLQEWENKFMSKYVTVGTIKHKVSVTEELNTVGTAEATGVIRGDANPAKDAPSESAATKPNEITSVCEADKELCQ